MVPRRVSRFITSLDKRDLGQSKYSQREKTKEIKREIVTSEKPHRGLDFNTARAIGESGPQESENQRTWAWYSQSLASLLFKKKLPFNLFLSFISQANQHGAL